MKKLYELPLSDFETGSEISNLIAAAGYIDGPIAVIGQNHWWSRTVDEIKAILEVNN